MPIEQRTKTLLRRMASNYVYVVRRGVAKGLKRKGGLGFVPQFSKMNPEECFLGSLELQAKTVYDIGAYEGVMTLFFARAVGIDGRVIAFEPNPANRSRLRENIALNDLKNTTIVDIAVADKCGNAELAIRDSEYATGSIDPFIKAQILGERGKLIHVAMDTLDNIVVSRQLRLPDFVKIDVEGYEWNVLNGMTQILEKARPDIFIELHGAGRQQKIRNARMVMELMRDSGYAIYHVELAREVHADDASVSEGHIYCTFGRVRTHS